MGAAELLFFFIFVILLIVMFKAFPDSSRPRSLKLRDALEFRMDLGTNLVIWGIGIFPLHLLIERLNGTESRNAHESLIKIVPIDEHLLSFTVILCLILVIYLWSGRKTPEAFEEQVIWLPKNRFLEALCSEIGGLLINIGSAVFVYAGFVSRGNELSVDVKSELLGVTFSSIWIVLGSWFIGLFARLAVKDNSRTREAVDVSIEKRQRESDTTAQPDCSTAI